MSKASSRCIREIEEEMIGNTGHRVLLVEGTDDVAAFSVWMTKSFGAEWENKWVVAEAGKKSLVLEILQEKPHWLGVIDRDEWSSDRIAELEAGQENLWVLPRYCIENYLIVPEELWQALPPIQQSKVQGGFHVFKELLTDDLTRWIKHGALWSVVNPLWEGLRSLGFKEALLSPDIVTDDAAVQQKLTEWHDFLEPVDIFNNYQQRLQEAQSLEVAEQLSRFVHGKKFYDTVVNSVLNDFLGQERAARRQTDIINSLLVPDDLHPLWEKMELASRESTESRD
ncbi:DUF4435 domain-containing protein [Endozoicomonas gorgoniicola]|uniref:DUF4435 domain-containing protein n=1 Tax=Endozoicomonas gorgoniicola TaxID=1234144 RepID=A0ABT3N1S1_9GAMM|nr:DUF4435 domain-containing protein [Endozoicomonas gorgoniicola]MCW7555578.1 DUF4435 domain-containing protein [Endozoicomonas gorgoniicola]